MLPIYQQQTVPGSTRCQVLREEVPLWIEHLAGLNTHEFPPPLPSQNRADPFPVLQGINTITI